MHSALPIVGLLKNPRYSMVFLLLASLLAYLNYYVMAHLPGEKDLMCVIGGGLTATNIIFAGVMSIMAGFVLIGFLETTLSRKNGSLKAGSSSLAGLVAGGLTTFCTLCTLPVISLFGFSVGLGFFTDYEIHFKVLSLLLLGFGFYIVNRDLSKGCHRCVN